MTPVAARVGEIAKRESIAVNWVRMVDFLRKAQSEEVILLP